ncbi:hypothetical protein Esti_004758 [Eimeria stiedai]
MFALTSSLAGPPLGPLDPDQQQQLQQEHQQQQRENQQQQEWQQPQQLADSASALKAKQNEVTSAAKEEAEFQYSLQQQRCQEQPDKHQQQLYHQRQLEQEQQQHELPRQQRLQEDALYFCIELEKETIPSWEWADTQVLGQHAAGVLALEAVLKATKATAAAKAAEQAKTTIAGPAAAAQDASIRATATPQATTAATETAETDVSSASKVQQHLQQLQHQQQQQQPERVGGRCCSTPPSGSTSRSSSTSSNKRRRASVDFVITAAARKDEDIDTCKALARGSFTTVTAPAAATTAAKARTTAPAPDSTSTELGGGASSNPPPSSSDSKALAAEPAATKVEAATGKKEEEDEGKNHLSASLFLLPGLAERRLVVSAFTAPFLVQNFLQQRSKLDGIFERGHGQLYYKARDALFPQDASRNRNCDNRAGDKLQEIVRFVDSWCSSKCGRCCNSSKISSSGSNNDSSNTSSSSRKLGCGLLGVLRGPSSPQGSLWGVHSVGSSEKQPTSAATSFVAPGPTAATKENNTAQAPTPQDRAVQAPPVRVFLDICGGPGSWSLFLLRQLAPEATAAAFAAAATARGTPVDGFSWATRGPKVDVFAAIAEEVRRRLAKPQKQQQQQQQQQAEVFGFGITLKSEGTRKEADWYQQLMHHANFTALWGRDGTGNIYAGNNLLHAQQTIFAFLRGKKHQQQQEQQQQQQQQHEHEQKKQEQGMPMTDPVNGFEEGVALVLADGGFAFPLQDGQHVENYQELLVGRLLISEFMLMLLLLQEGGHFVIKILDCFSLFTASLIYCVSQLFENSLILKPFSSRAVNSERYLIGLHLKSRTSRVFAPIFSSVSHVVSLFQSYAPWQLSHRSKPSPLVVFATDTRFIESLRQASTTLCQRQTAALEKVIAKVEEMVQAKKERATRNAHTGSSGIKKPSLTSFEHNLEQLNLLSKRPSNSSCSSSNSSTTPGAAGRRRRQLQQPGPLQPHQPYNARSNAPQPPPFRFSYRNSGNSSNAAPELLFGHQQQRESETHRLQQQLRQLERQLHKQREDQQKQQQLQLQMQLLHMQQLQMLQYRNLGGVTTELNQHQLLLPPQQQVHQLEPLISAHQQLLHPQQQTQLQQQLLLQLRAYRQQTQHQQQDVLPIHKLQQQLAEQQLDSSTSAQLQQQTQPHQNEQQLQHHEQQQQQLQQQLQLHHLQKLLTEKRSQSTKLLNPLQHQASWATRQTTASSAASNAATAASAATGGSAPQTNATLPAIPALPGVAHRSPAAAAAGERDGLVGLSHLGKGASSILEQQQVQQLMQHQQQQGSGDFDLSGLGVSCSSPLEAAAQQQLLLLQHERAKLVLQQQQLQSLQQQLLQGGLHKQQQQQQQRDEQLPKHELTGLLQQKKQLQQLQQQQQLLHKLKQQQQGEGGGLVALDSVLAEATTQRESEF